MWTVMYYTNSSVFMTCSENHFHWSKVVGSSIHVYKLFNIITWYPPPQKKNPLIKNYFCSTSLQNELNYERKSFQQVPVKGKNQVKSCFSVVFSIFSAVFYIKQRPLIWIMIGWLFNSLVVRGYQLSPPGPRGPTQCSSDCSSAHWLSTPVPP